jgi:hypothetical protein
MITHEDNLTAVHEYFSQAGAGPLKEQQSRASGILYVFSWGDNLLTVEPFGSNQIKFTCAMGDKEMVDREFKMLEAMMSQQLEVESGSESQ